MSRSVLTTASPDDDRANAEAIADSIAEAYAELVAAWPRAEENRDIRSLSELLYSDPIRMGTVVK